MTFWNFLSKPRRPPSQCPHAILAIRAFWNALQPTMENELGSTFSLHSGCKFYFIPESACFAMVFCHIWSLRDNFVWWQFVITWLFLRAYRTESWQMDFIRKYYLKGQTRREYWKWLIECKIFELVVSFKHPHKVPIFPYLVAVLPLGGVDCRKFLEKSMVIIERE